MPDVAVRLERPEIREKLDAFRGIQALFSTVAAFVAWFIVVTLSERRNFPSSNAMGRSGWLEMPGIRIGLRLGFVAPCNVRRYRQLSFHLLDSLAYCADFIPYNPRRLRTASPGGIQWRFQQSEAWPSSDPPRQ